MSAPVNQRSEQIKRSLRAERQFEDMLEQAARTLSAQARLRASRATVQSWRDAEDLAEDARDPLDTARGVAAGLVLTVILAIIACSLLWLIREWVAAGGWVR